MVLALVVDILLPKEIQASGNRVEKTILILTVGRGMLLNLALGDNFIYKCLLESDSCVEVVSYKNA